MKFIKAIYWRLFIIKLSLRWINKTYPGDRVMYKNEIWGVSNAVYENSYSIVKGFGTPDHQYIEFAPRSECKKMMTFKDMWHSFKYGYKFYMINWYSIWIHKGIEPWMRECPIWAK